MGDSHTWLCTSQSTLLLSVPMRVLFSSVYGVGTIGNSMEITKSSYWSLY